MSYASIGGITCTFLKGWASSPKQKLDLFEVPGFDGHGAQAVGRRGEVKFTAIAYGADASAVVEWSLAIQSLQGQIVSAFNDWGVENTGCGIVEISLPLVTPCRGMLWGSAVTCRGEHEITGVLAGGSSGFSARRPLRAAPRAPLRIISREIIASVLGRGGGIMSGQPNQP